MSKLYRVTVEFEMVVQADDEDHAWEVALSSASSAVDDCGSVITIGSEIIKKSELPEKWDDMCLPYGGDGNQRIKDIIKEPS